MRGSDERGGAARGGATFQTPSRRAPPHPAATSPLRRRCYLIWQLCTLDDKGLVAFLFDLYDEFNNDLVEYDDVERMLGDAYGTANLEADDMQELIEYVKERGVLTRPEFSDFCMRTPQVVRVIMDTQRRMRIAILGSAVWTNLERKRKMKTDPVFQPANWSRLIEKIIVMDIESREEQERMARLQEMKTGKRVKRINIKGVSDGDQEGHERYEP